MDESGLPRSSAGSSGSQLISQALARLRLVSRRGTKQIGGTCVELEYAGSGVLLDLGMPLDADLDIDPATLLPDISGLDGRATYAFADSCATR